MTLIRPDRRDILRLIGAGAGMMGTGLAALPAAARSFLGGPVAGNPAHFNFTLGKARLSVVSDGWFAQPMSAQAINAPEAEKAAFIAAHYLDPEANYAHTNHLYVELGDARVLVDVGGGNRFFPTEGRLMGNLEAAGIDAQAITHVVITHAHPDHIWGIRDDFDEPLIADAEYIIGAREHGYWLQDGLIDRVGAEGQQFVAGAVNSLNADGVEWVLAGAGHEVAPGIRLIDTPGHTPGHMSLVVESEGKQLIALGDCLRHAVMDFARPDWVGSVDLDPVETTATRRRVLDMAAADEMAVLGYHFPFPGLGHVVARGAAWEFVPALWRF